MQNLSKRLWGPSLTIKQASDIIISWCIKAREKNILRKNPPAIFYAYVLEDTPQLNLFANISSLFKYSQKDLPYYDQTRDSALRALSVALKAHYFMFPDDTVCFEPYFFVIPNLREPSKTTIGLIYKIEKEDKCIVVCEEELERLYSSEDNKILYRFPAVVGEDSFKWYHMKNWYRIKQEAKIEANKPWCDTNWQQKCKEAVDAEELSQYAAVLDVPFEIKDEIKPLGIEWANKAKKWYLPKGFDVDSVNEYIEYRKKVYLQKNPQAEFGVKPTTQQSNNQGNPAFKKPFSKFSGKDETK